MPREPEDYNPWHVPEWVSTREWLERCRRTLNDAETRARTDDQQGTDAQTPTERDDA